MSLPDNGGAESSERMMEEMREAKSLGTSSRRLGIGLLALALIIPNVFVVLTSLSSQSAQAGWWDPRILVTDGIDNLDGSLRPVVSIGNSGNVHVVWVDGVLDGSGPDGDIFYRKWNSTALSWETRVLITDDNANNTESSRLPDVETDSFGNVHIVWQQFGDLNGSGSNADIFWRMWNATTNGWGARVLATDEPSNLHDVHPSLAADHLGNVHLTWRTSSPGLNIQYKKWNGTTEFWGQRMAVFDNSTNSDNPHIAVGPSGNVHVAWEDAANISGASSNGSDQDVFHRRLDVNTNTWGPISHVNDDDESDSTATNFWGIASDIFGNVHIIWEDQGEQSGSGADADIFYRKLNSTTEEWEPRVLVSNDPANTGYSSDARICTDPGGNVHIAWIDTSDVDGAGPNRGDVFYKKWDALTGIWNDTMSLTNDLLDNYQPSKRPGLDADNLGNVVVVWTDPSGLLGSGPDLDVYLRWYESGIVLPDYMPMEVTPSTATRVLAGSMNTISAKVYNGGEAATLTSSVAFYNSTSPGSPFYQGVVPPLGRVEKSSLHQGVWTAPPVPGSYEITIEVDYGDAISELSENNNFHTIEFMVESPPLPPPPPANLTAQVTDNDGIFLNWTVSNSTSIDHYLIYRSTDQREFDFSTPAYDTSADTDPLRTNWTDVDAANLSAPREFYYVVRAVNGLGNMSITSNTAGKWTRSFISGLNAFSLPLDPFEDQNISDYAVGIPNVDLIRWMDLNGHWVSHYPSMGPGINDSPARMGEGYEISLSLQATYTFVGSPASMIRFQEGLGDSVIFRKSLSASIEGNDVNLSWIAPVGADRYLVFRSDKRDGLHDLSLSPIANTTKTYWRDAGIIGNQNSEYYYMVIPLDSAGGTGSSTYSVGVFTIIYQAGSGTFALPLKPAGTNSLDWFCDNIPNVVGMAYMVFEMWKFHAGEMPSGVYDSVVQVSEGFQISMSGIVLGRFTFVGW
ncbi:MAG: hypothetical protein KAR39_06720 [Thermoplasmata archaeon]|nr:hypothetical protein [Thermoplasmata archaeon]